MRGDPLVRLAGIAFVLGGLITLVFNILHPLPGKDLEATMQGLLDHGVGMWVFGHLMLALGLWLLAVGFIGVRWSLRNEPGGVIARFGLYAVIIGTSAWVVHFALDGSAWAETVSAWDQAEGSRRETLFVGAELLRNITDATFLTTTIFYWSALVLMGIGIAKSSVHPRWLGWALIVISTVLVALGVYALFHGDSPTWDLLFAAFATLTVLWALYTGIWMVGRTRRAA